MPFCTSCGKETAPGNKFCEFCGAPVELSSAPPGSPPVASAPPALAASSPPAPRAAGSGKTWLVAGIIFLILVAAALYAFGVIRIGGLNGAGEIHPAGPVPPASLSATPEPAHTVPVVTAETSAAVQTYEEKYTETYTQVYTANHAFIGGQKEVFPLNLVSPPLYIKYNITPTIESGEKVDELGNMVNTSYISPRSWFTVSVYDAGTGNLVEEQGFNKGYSVDTRQEFMVRAPGNYRVEMAGSDVTAEIWILTGK